MASRKVVVRVLVCGKDKSHLVEQLFILEKLLAPDPTCQPPIRLTSLGRDHNEAARGGALTRGELPGAGSWPWLDLSILQVGSGLGRADRLTVPLGACRSRKREVPWLLSVGVLDGEKMNRYSPLTSGRLVNFMKVSPHGR